MRFDTPPSSDRGDEEIPDDDFEDDEFIYMGDVDEVMDTPEDDNPPPESDEEDYVDDAQLVFEGHKSSVFCVSVHPQGKYVATGGEDDKAYVWNSENGQILLECSDFEDSVIICRFSFDGAYLIMADMSGLVRAYKCPSESEDSWNVVWSTQTDDLLWGFWHFAAHVFICCTVAGDVYIWKIPAGDTKVLSSHGSASSDGVLTRDGKRLAVSYEDSSVKVWDIKTASCLHHINTPLQNNYLISIDTYHDNNLIIGGSSHGQIFLMKSNNGAIVGNIDCNAEVEIVKFSKDPNLGLFAVGTLDGTLLIWDVARQIMRQTCSIDENSTNNGVTCLIWIENYVVTGCLNGEIIVIESKSGNLVKTFKGHKGEILEIAYIPALNSIASSSGDGTCRIFDLSVIKT